MRALSDGRVGERSVLLPIAMNPHVLYLQPGTAMAPSFDPATSSRICESVVAPQIRLKAFGPAAMAGFGAIRGQIAQSNEARRQRAAATGQHSFQSRLNLGIWVAAVGLIGLVVFASRRGLLSQSGGSAESGSSDSYSSSYSSTDSSSSSSSSDSGSSSDGSGGGGSAW